MAQIYEPEGCFLNRRFKNLSNTVLLFELKMARNLKFEPAAIYN